MRYLTTLALLLSAGALLAQQDMGVITGVVTDSTGAVVGGARVSVVDAQTNETRATETSGAGAYTVGPLRIGDYNITVEKSGFKKSVWRGITLHAQDRARADFQLEVGAMAESISITAEAPLLQAETATMSNVVAEHEVRQLPLNGRNFQQLAWLAAGVSPATRSRDQTSGFNSHGQQTTQNNFIIDGVDNNNNVMGMQDRKAQVVVPSLDAVAEFKVETSNYSAEFGRNSGAVMIVSIKSGSNSLHGTAYEYLRNDVFDSRDTFNQVDRTGDGKADPEKLRQNQFGATLGGPIIHNRTFFFGSWERLEQRFGQVDLAIVPTAAERSGLFPATLGIVKDPATGQPFPGNQIPLARFDTTAAKLSALWPQPNFAGHGSRQNFSSSPPKNATRDGVDGRIDHNISDNDKIFGRFSRQIVTSLQGSEFPLPARGDQDNNTAINDNAAYSIAFSYTKILKPTLINEFRYGFIRQKVNLHELDTQLLSELTAQYGIKGIPGSPVLFGLPFFQLNGGINYAGFGEPGSMPNYKIHQVHQYLDALSWNKGNHNFKFGTDLHWNRSDITGGNGAHGNFQFGGQFTGNSLGDFLLGRPTSSNDTTLLAGQMRFQNFMFYALDDWKFTPRLTLNLGVRYELTTPWYEKHNNLNQLVITPGKDFNTIQTAGYCGGSYSCRGLVNIDTNNWAPRAGVAYQMNNRTVIRAGGGVFYGGQGSVGANGRGVNNFPFVRSVTLQSTSTAPPFQLSSGFPVGILDSVTTPPANSNWIDWAQNLPEPTVYQWNLAVQRELFRDFALTVGYVGSASSYLADAYNWNGAPPGPPATEKNRRAIPNWNNITLQTPFGHSSYNGLDVHVERRYKSGLSLSGSYTWSHSIDNIAELFGSGGGTLQDYSNFNGSRGNSNFDTRHRFVNAVVYELPFGKGRQWLNRGGPLNQILGGWQLSSILSLQTGHYFSLTVTNARTRLGASAIGDWRVDRIGNGAIDNPTPGRWFDKSAFTLPQSPDGSWHFGSAGRDILASDGPANLDAGLMKTFDITERVHAQFRWEVFNLSNSPLYADPVVSIDSPDFGKVNSTVNSPRQMQFGLRISF